MTEKEEKKQGKPRRPQAKKRDLQNEKKRLHNKIFVSQVRTAIRAFDKAVSQKDAALTKGLLNTVYGLMDKGVKHRVFKINKASRTKSRLTARAAASVSR
ncbi:MAG TPA: 30S ribosomal protein S20 [Waddliaceae bacterium]